MSNSYLYLHARLKHLRRKTQIYTQLGETLVHNLYAQHKNNPPYPLQYYTVPLVRTNNEKIFY